MAFRRGASKSFDKDQTMKFSHSILAAIIWLAITLTAPSAFAGPADYLFEPVKVEVKNGQGAELAIRLVHKGTGKPVEGAVLFRTRLDMSPDSMGEMTAQHVAMPTSEPASTVSRPI